MSRSAAFTAGLHEVRQRGPFVRYQRSFGGPSDQMAHRLAKREPIALGMRLCHLHGVFFELKRRSGHASIMSPAVML